MRVGSIYTREVTCHATLYYTPACACALFTPERSPAMRLYITLQHARVQYLDQKDRLPCNYITLQHARVQYLHQKDQLPCNYYTPACACAVFTPERSTAMQLVHSSMRVCSIYTRKINCHATIPVFRWILINIFDFHDLQSAPSRK